MAIQADPQRDVQEFVFCYRCGEVYQFERRRGRLRIPKRLRCRGCGLYVETCNWRALQAGPAAAPAIEPAVAIAAAGVPPAEPAIEPPEPGLFDRSEW